MTEQETMASYAERAISSMRDTVDKLNSVVYGKKQSSAQALEHVDTFDMVIRRLAAIAEGDAIADLQAARRDLQYAFSLLHHLRGGYPDMWTVLTQAQLRCADLITQEEAEEILGPYKMWLRLDARSGLIHLYVQTSSCQSWEAYNATYLDYPDPDCYKVRYVGYEIRDRRVEQDRQEADLAKWRKRQEQKSEEKAS